MFFDGEEIKDLPLRTNVIVGPAGPTGNQGVGVITGGLTGQVLAKKSNVDYDTQWVNQSGGGGTGVVTWGSITGTLSFQTDLQDALNLKAPSTNIPASSITGLATVATSGSYNDLLNKPTIPNAQVNSDWASVTGVSQILNKPNLAVVATSGSYTDLSNKPTYSDVGAAPASGISPSAISGIAVITTDPRLSDSRTPTGSASGDLSGVYPNPNVVKLHGYSVSATSPSNGQILQWGGESWLPASIPQGGSGGGGISYFLNFNESAIGAITGLPTSPNSPKRLSREGTITQSSYTSAHLSQANYDLIAGFVSDPSDPNVTQIPAGLWDFNIWADSNANNSNECILRLFVYKYDGTATTLLSESDDIYVYDPTVINQYLASVVFPFTTILATDRIYIELRGKATTNNIDISLHFGNVTPSHAHTTFSSVAGTGVVKVVNGVFQTPANLIFDADVDASAAISQGKIANLTSDLAGKAPATGISPSAISGTAVITTDSRLSDARTPLAHKSTHAVGGSDSLTPADIGAAVLAAIDTDANASVFVNLSGFLAIAIPNQNYIQNGKPSYAVNIPSQPDGNTFYSLYWNGSQWYLNAEFSDESGGYYRNWAYATGNTTYPWQATWTFDKNGQPITAIRQTLNPTASLGTTSAVGVATTASRSDHVHPFPTPADISAATAAQGVKADQAIANGGGIPKIIEVTEAEYAALTPEEVDETATYIVNSTATQNATNYQGKEFGDSKPVSLLTQPVIIGNGNRISSSFSLGGIDYVQAYGNNFLFTTNLTPAAIFNGTITKTDEVITGGANSFVGQQKGQITLNSATKGGGLYDATTAFIPDEKDSPSTFFGRIININPTNGTSSIAWDFNTSTPAVSRADIASQVWSPQDCMVDVENNKLFVSSAFVSSNTEGSSIARFSIDPTTKVLTPDSWVKAVTPNGSSISYIFRMVLLPDEYIFVSNYDFSILTPAFQVFDAYGASAGNATNVAISFAAGNPVQGATFKADTTAPSGIGYLLLCPRTGSEAGKIYAYDYQGEGVFNTTAIDSADLTLIAKNAGLWSNSFKLEIGSLSVTSDGAIICSIRTTATTPIPRCVIAFNWIPYAKSGTISTQNANNVAIRGGSISGVRNLAPKVEYINSTRFWYRDELAKFIRVQAWGGGGGGGSGRKDSTANVVRSGGSGGGGGAYVDVTFDASLISTAETEVAVTIGGGGSGGASQTTNGQNGNSGSAGGVTSLSVGSLLIRANGGGAGGGGTAAAVTGGAGSVQAGTGGASSATGGSGSQGLPIGSLSSTITIGQGGAGGGAGGGLTTANATSAGGAGGNAVTTGSSGVAGGAANGGSGNSGIIPLSWTAGGGGSGGGSNTAGNSGGGGTGGPASGGGGSGSTQNGNSGTGGNGGNGFMVITTLY
jgi:hypothetical protein